MRLLCVAVIAALAAAPSAPAEEFNQWRGPQRNGVVADSPPLADTWPEDGPKLLWTTEAALKDGYGSIAVASGRAYVYVNEKYRVPLTTRILTEKRLESLGWSSGKPPARIVKAVEAARLSDERAKLEGEQRREWIDKWMGSNLTEDERKECRRFVSDRLHRGEKAVPLAVLDKLATIRDKEFADANELDKWLAGAGIDGELTKTVLRAIPTYVEKGWDRLYCFSIADGKTLWAARHDAEPASNASGTPCVVDGRCCVAGTGGMVYCHDAADGQVVWQVPGGGRSTVAVDGPHMAVFTGNKKLGLVLYRIGPDKAEQLWSLPDYQQGEASPVIFGGCVYASCRNTLVCVRLSTGKVAWERKTGARGTSSPVIADGKILAYTSRHVQLIRATPTAYQLLASMSLRMAEHSSPTVDAGRLYVRTRDAIACYDLRP